MHLKWDFYLFHSTSDILLFAAPHYSQKFCVLLSIYPLVRVNAANNENQGSVILSHIWSPTTTCGPGTYVQRELLWKVHTHRDAQVLAAHVREWEQNLKTKWVNRLMGRTCSTGDKHLPRANEPFSNVAVMHLADVLLLVLAKSCELMNWTFVFSISVTRLKYGMSCWHVQTLIHYWKMCRSLSLIGSHHALQR